MTESDPRETERRSPRFDGLDGWPTRDVLQALLGGQVQALHAVSAALPALDEAVTAAADRLRSSTGRLIYAGAGTSGRLAMLDGVELTPTFGWPHDRVAYLFAGGEGGLQVAVEGAEDDRRAAAREITELSVGPDDVVIGIAASGTTPYTCQILEIARASGALTIAMASNAPSPLLEVAELPVILASGAEVLAGSTRLGAGTAQKAALNLFSTALMVRLNKVHRGYMVDMQATNEKLQGRAKRMVREITGCDEHTAVKALAETGGHTKSAVLVASGCSATKAEELLSLYDGNLGRALTCHASKKE